MVYGGKTLENENANHLSAAVNSNKSRRPLYRCNQEAVEKCLDARRNTRNSEKRGVLVQYAAMPKNECNAAD